MEMSWPRFIVVLVVVSLAFFLAYAHVVTEASLAAIKFAGPALNMLHSLQGSNASLFAGHAIAFIVGAFLSAALLGPVLIWQRGIVGQSLCMTAVAPVVLVGFMGGGLTSFASCVSAVTPLIGAMVPIYIAKRHPQAEGSP